MEGEVGAYKVCYWRGVHGLENLINLVFVIVECRTNQVNLQEKLRKKKGSND